MLDVRRLRILRELSARGTLAEVAAALHLSPSSVSQQLSQLEREAGVPLLRRVGRGVQLTPAADVLVEHAAVILRQLEEAEADLAGLGTEASGTLRIAAFQSAALAFMPLLLADLASHHPRLRVTMSQRVPEQALREAAARGFDLVIAEQYPQHAAPLLRGLDRVPLTTDPLRLAVPAQGRRWARVASLADAAELPWVMEPPHFASRHWGEQQCRLAGFEPDVRFVTDDIQTHLALIEAGQAVALLSGLMLSHRPPDARLIELPGAPRRSVFTATRTSLSGTPAVVACRAALAAIVPPDIS